MNADMRNFDVLVVGCGIAGLSAAVAARQQGATVAILERAPIDERGGNTRHTGAWMRMKNEAEVSDDFEEHFAANGGGYIDPSLLKRAVEAHASQPAILRALSYVDPEVIATFAAEAPGTLAWLYLILAGLARFVVEFWRINPAVGFGLSEAQWFSVVLSALGLWKISTTGVKPST